MSNILYKVFLVCFLASLSVASSAQTKLLRHYSRSGSMSTFNPKKVEGNFGLPVQFHDVELLPDSSSSYQLIQMTSNTHGLSRTDFQLFYRDSLSEMHLLHQVTAENVDSLKQVMTTMLMEYRMKED